MVSCILQIGLLFLIYFVIKFTYYYTSITIKNAKKVRKDIEKAHRHRLEIAGKVGYKRIINEIKKCVKNEEYKAIISVGDTFFETSPTEAEVQEFVDDVSNKLKKEGYLIKSEINYSRNLIRFVIEW